MAGASLAPRRARLVGDVPDLPGHLGRTRDGLSQGAGPFGACRGRRHEGSGRPDRGRRPRGPDRPALSQARAPWLQAQVSSAVDVDDLPCSPAGTNPAATAYPIPVPPPVTTIWRIGQLL